MKTRLIALKRCWNILEILDGLLVVLLCFRMQESYCSTCWNISLEHCTMKVYIVCECLHYIGILCSFDSFSAMQIDIFQDNTFYKNNKYICKQLKTSQFLLLFFFVGGFGSASIRVQFLELKYVGKNLSLDIVNSFYINNRHQTTYNKNKINQ